MTSWFYNKVASIFKDSIRSYVESHLNVSLDSYSMLILDLCNKYAQQYYHTLLQIVMAARKGAEDSKLVQGKTEKSAAEEDASKEQAVPALAVENAVKET
eukprot:1394224-Amorphochlora_amoeboformis.AAC.1